jgi:hypothetical protein
VCKCAGAQWRTLRVVRGSLRTTLLTQRVPVRKCNCNASMFRHSVAVVLA